MEVNTTSPESLWQVHCESPKARVMCCSRSHAITPHAGQQSQGQLHLMRWVKLPSFGYQIGIPSQRFLNSWWKGEKNAASRTLQKDLNHPFFSWNSMKFLANKTVVLIPSPARNGRNFLARVGRGSGIKSRYHIDIKKKVLKIHAYIYIRINIVFYISLSYFKNISSDMHLTLHHFRPTANLSGIRLSDPLTTGVTVRQSQPVAIGFQAWPEALTALMRFK